MNSLIQGHVAQVLNSRELVINRGSEHGVAAGMKFAVLDTKARDIEDPITGETLGSVYRPKVQVKVFRVEPKLALARTFKSRRKNVGGMGVGGAAISRMFEPPKYVREYETFKTDASTWEELDEEQSYVKIGDPVEQLVEVQDFDEPQGTTVEP